MAVMRNPPREQLRLVHVLEALANPLRLRAVVRLADGIGTGADGECPCGRLLPELSKSTASHHWRVLRESGVLHQRRDGRRLLMHLRRADLDARFPGLLDDVLAAARQDRDVIEQEPEGRVVTP